MSQIRNHAESLLVEEQAKYPDMDPGLGPLLTQMAYASKIIAREVGRAALVGKLGLMGDKNATGHSQKSLDVYANEVVVGARSARTVFCMPGFRLEWKPGGNCRGENSKYVMCCDRSMARVHIGHQWFAGPSSGLATNSWSVRRPSAPACLPMPRGRLRAQ